MGKDFVDWAVDKKRISREKAIFMGKQLVSRKFGTSVDNDQEFRVRENWALLTYGGPVRLWIMLG